MLPAVVDGYGQLLTELKQKTQAAQLRASVSVNRELVTLYWQIGREILVRQERESWGAKVIDRLAADLKSAFPNMRGFSPRNLKYMRAFAEAWPDELIVQQLVAQMPWGHNVRILDQVRSAEVRKWYVQATLDHGWRRDILVHQIESRLYERQGKAVTNFRETLPPPQSDLAQQILKDPLSAVNDLLRHPDDQPSVGLILCKTRDRVVAEYALRDVSKPIGVSEYELAAALPDDLKGTLPTIEELGNELSGETDEE